jgi:outer membrane protein assembly factor BamB
MSRISAVLALLACYPAVIGADNWPAWRGPDGQGNSLDKNLPLKWSKTENIKWRVPLAEPGNSTPIVWGQRIFLTQANKGGTVRGLLCFDRNDGKELWKQEVAYNEKERNWNDAWYCNASPVTDGERVIVSYGSAGMYCYDFDGKVMWKRTDLGKWEHAFGNGASPVLYGDTVILWCGPNEGKGRNFLLAANKKTGETVWEHDEKVGSWSTPLLTKVNGQDQLLLAMSSDVKGAPDDKTGSLKGFDPKTGKELWNCRGINSYCYTSPLVGNGIAVQMAGFSGSALAVKLGGSGDITKDRLWLHPKNIQRVGSGAIVGDHVYVVDENGMPRCYELMTGKEVWQVEKRPGGSNTWSSILVAGERLYVQCHNGDTLVFAANPKYEHLATNKLGEGTYASFAVSNGEIFTRTAKTLWCIAEKK